MTIFTGDSTIYENATREPLLVTFTLQRLPGTDKAIKIRAEGVDEDRDIRMKSGDQARAASVVVKPRGTIRTDLSAGDHDDSVEVEIVDVRRT